MEQKNVVPFHVIVCSGAQSPVLGAGDNVASWAYGSLAVSLDQLIYLGSVIEPKHFRRAEAVDRHKPGIVLLLNVLSEVADDIRVI